MHKLEVNEFGSSAHIPLTIKCKTLVENYKREYLARFQYCWYLPEPTNHIWNVFSNMGSHQVVKIDS
jgi:hypothetical protein